MADQQSFEHREHDKTELPEFECRRLLATQTLGRVGLTIGALPVIMAVEYSYDKGVVTFGIDADERLGNAANGHVLAFEVDAYDPETGNGWSVHVLGRAMVTTSESSRSRAVHLACEIVDGRFLADSRT